MATPSSYVLNLHTDVENGMAYLTLSLFDGHGSVLHEERHEWVTFCWTWRDLAEFVERRWQQHGGALNHLSRPSPYVDMT